MAAGDDVVALSRSASEPETAGARAVAVDLLDAAATGRAIAQAEPEVVYHLAALASSRAPGSARERRCPRTRSPR